MLRLLLIVATFALLAGRGEAQEAFVGPFAEPLDGGNLDTRHSTFDGSTVVIVPRGHPSEAIAGAVRWRNVLFALRGVKGKAPVFALPLTSPKTHRRILSADPVSFQNIKLVWSYDPNGMKWNTFDRYERSGTDAASWTVQASNRTAFERDVVYVSINEHFPVSDYYDWLETEVFAHRFVRPTPSESVPGSFVIGFQSGAPASVACGRTIPDMPLFGFVIQDLAARPRKLVMLVSGQHPYEGQNKVALQAAVDWILNSASAEAIAYRATYVTLVYPFVNPTGELAGLWRGTAWDPTKDVNRNWNTTETVPARNRGIDTVIVHKNAMQKDIAALGLGEPYAVFDYHQNFGDHPERLDYVLHASLGEFTPYFGRLSATTGMADAPSDLETQETLRGYMGARGVALPVTFERSVYHTMASEQAFGVATVKALVDPAAVLELTGESAVRPAQPPPRGPVLVVREEFAAESLLARGWLAYRSRAAIPVPQRGFPALPGPLLSDRAGSPLSEGSRFGRW